ncbi:MAG TPA: SRPBCC family protein [Burkholderiales bacterium]|nr:SRPBCC family protein [Burkholderiales bacterium]
MARIERSIEVSAPLRALYGQWTRFEDFPRFMEGVREVRRLDDTRLHWRAQIGGKDKRWEARITEQVPDQRIAWQSVSGTENSGSVELEPLGESRTRVTVKMSYGPEGVLENVGDALGLTARRVEGDLARFKRLAEGRGADLGPPPRSLGGAWDEPVAALRRASEHVDRLFETFAGRARPRVGLEAPGTWVPHVELSRRGPQYIVSVDLPGVRREDVQIDVDDALIVIRGERRKEDARGASGVLRSECSYGRFYRAVPLPEGAKPESARAVLRDGVLEIALPLPPKREPRRLEIEDAGIAAHREAYAYQADPANEPHPREPDGEHDRRERRDWQSEGRLGM